MRSTHERPARVLLTSFEPFDGAATNPSIPVAGEVKRRLTGAPAAGAAIRVEHRTLPVAFARATAALTAAINELQPDIVLSIGLASGRTRPSFERLAVNLMDARIPDNDGTQPADGEIVPGGPTALWTTLPVKAALIAADAAGIPAELSMTAGTYVCNAVFYQGAYAAQGGPLRAGFVHVPDCETEADIHASADAVEVLARTALRGTPDPVLALGEVS